MSEELNEEQKQEAQTVAVEKEARLMGWVPKEDFRDGDHWADAETFVKRGKEINPILRKNNELLLKKLESAQTEITEIKQAAKEFEVFQKEATERKLLDMEKQLKDLKEQKKAAITAADGDSVVAIDEAIDAVKDEQAATKEAAKPKEKKPDPVTLDPIITSWMEKNEWFTTDDKMTRIADAIGISINQQFPHLKGEKFFEKLDEELEEVLPEKYKKTARRNPVEGNTSGSSRPLGTKKNSFENLPQDAKAACDRMIKQGYKMTREQYVADYDWS